MKTHTHPAVLATFLMITMLAFTACGTNIESSPTYEENYNNESHLDNHNTKPTPYVNETYDTSHTISAMPSESEQQKAQLPSNLNIHEERLQQFYDFFHPFLVAFGVLPTLGDYDSRTPESEYVALEFVLSTGIFINGRRGHIGIPYYGFAEHIGGEPFSEWSFQVSYEFLSTSYVDYKLLQYFGIEGFNHTSINFTDTFGFEYHNGRYYYMALAQGGAMLAIPNIFEIYDNSDGLYFVRIQYLATWWGVDDEQEHMQYNIAVVETIGETFRLLYWKNDVPQNAEFPVF